MLHILSQKGRQVRNCCHKEQITHLVLECMFMVGVYTQPLPSVPSLDNGPQMELTRVVWDLDDDLEALQIEMGRREGKAPPHRSPQSNLRVPGGSSEFDMDDREVDPRRGRGWRYGKPVQWPTSLPWVNVDGSHLLSMLTAGLRMGIPRINTFSEVSFKQWYHEVQRIKDHYP